MSSLSQHLILIKFPSWSMSEYAKQFRGLPKCQAYSPSWFNVVLRIFPCSDDREVSLSHVCSSPGANHQVRAAAPHRCSLQLQSKAVKILNEA